MSFETQRQSVQAMFLHVVIDLPGFQNFSRYSSGDNMAEDHKFFTFSQKLTFESLVELSLLAKLRLTKSLGLIAAFTKLGKTLMVENKISCG